MAKDATCDNPLGTVSVDLTRPYETTSVMGFCLPPSTSDLPPKAKKGYRMMMEEMKNT